MTYDNSKIQITKERSAKNAFVYQLASRSD